MQIIMLNTNVFGRPFDKLDSKEIMDEALASYKIFSLAYSGLIEVKTSDVLFSEVSMIKDELKRKFVFYLISCISNERVKLNKDISRLADLLSQLIKDYMDSLHIAFAAVSGCSHLITCDKELLNAWEDIENLLSQNGFKAKITNPVAFIKDGLSMV